MRFRAGGGCRGSDEIGRSCGRRSARPSPKCESLNLGFRARSRASLVDPRARGRANPWRDHGWCSGDAAERQHGDGNVHRHRGSVDPRRDLQRNVRQPHRERNRRCPSGLVRPRATAPVLLAQGTLTSGTSGTFSGSGTLTPEQVAGLLAAKTYCEVDDPAFPSGEIRGQLSPPSAAPALMPVGVGWLALALGGAGIVLLRARERATRRLADR